MSIPIFQFILPPLSPLETVSLFITSTTLFMFCKWIHLHLSFNIPHINNNMCCLSLTYFTQYDYLEVSNGKRSMSRLYIFTLLV